MGIFIEVWEREAIKKFRADDSFLSEIPDKSNLAKNGVIHLTDLGADPDVLINNTTYPIPVNPTNPTDIPIVLDKFDTTNEAVSDDILYAVAIDVISEVLDSHTGTLNEKMATKAAHALAPLSNSLSTPVVPTTGASDGEANPRKAITSKDLTKLKRLFDKADIPMNDRVLVLCPEHFAQICDFNQNFALQYSNIQEGQILKLYGFKVYQFTKMPVYTSGLSKIGFGALPNPTTDCYASFAFSSKEMFKAKTDLKVYLSPAESNPTTRSNTLGLRVRGIVLPKKNRAIGAIVSVPVS